ncbi:hypothetical protein KAH81_03490 [bacterium]|nr:hypothetical protein [bacterium]
MLFIFVGCDNGNGSDPNEPIDTNYTNVDPPFIESVTGPGQLIVGNEAQFYCEILSDAEILRKSWNLDLSAGGYFYPSSVTEGGFTPSGLRPDPFVQTDTGEAPTFNYSKRGKYTAALEIEDADGYIERSGTMVSVIPETADSAGVHIVRAASTDTVLGEDFDFLRFGLIADNVVPACVYADGYDAFSAYSYIDCDISPGYRIVRTKVETGKRIGIEGSGWFVARISVDFDVEGALHLWGGGSEDMVEYAAYITVQHTDGLPRTHYIYSKSLNSSSLDEAFYLNGNHVVEDTLNVMGNEEYEFWFGVETFQYLAPSDSSGSAVCFDDAVAPTKLNRVMFTLEK